MRNFQLILDKIYQDVLEIFLIKSVKKIKFIMFKSCFLLQSAMQSLNESWINF